MFSVITPSFNQLSWLKLCAASISDQQGVECEHIVQDAGSGEGLQEWAATQPNVRLFVEKDEGMYDAINCGLRRASGEMLAQLNCDEQYLPGALQAVEGYFCEHPEIDIAFGDAVVVDGAGRYLFHRKASLPRKAHTAVCQQATLTCATFFRRRVIDDHELFFRDDLRYRADAEWLVAALGKGVRMGLMRQFTSVFTQTQANLSLETGARMEKERLLRGLPWWLKAAKPVLIAQHRVRRLLGGVYFQKPFEYSIFTKDNPHSRVTFQVRRPVSTWRWHEGSRHADP